jgi:hypothetical protein
MTSLSHLGHRKLRGTGNLCDKEGKIQHSDVDISWYIHFSVVKTWGGYVALNTDSEMHTLLHRGRAEMLC